MGDGGNAVTPILVTLVAAGTVGALSFRAQVTARASKMLASTAFVVLALVSGALDTTFGGILLGGLLLAWCGDLLLSYQSSHAFLGGLVSFLLGHVAYTTAFLVRGADVAVTVVGSALMGVFAVALLSWLVPHVGRGMRGPVIAYTVVISFMVAAAAGTHAADPSPRLLMAAILFTLSDVGVARDRFVTPGQANRIIGLPMYYTAQTLFALAAGG